MVATGNPVAKIYGQQKFVAGTLMNGDPLNRANASTSSQTSNANAFFWWLLCFAGSYFCG